MSGDRPVCGGGVIIEGLTVGCGAPLRYELTTGGIDYWRCPRCGNPHWWISNADLTPEIPR